MVLKSVIAYRPIYIDLYYTSYFVCSTRVMNFESVRCPKWTGNVCCGFDDEFLAMFNDDYFIRAEDGLEMFKTIKAIRKS